MDSGSAGSLPAAADQHLDPPVALGPLISEGARLDPMSRHSFLDQRITHSVDTTLA